MKSIGVVLAVCVVNGYIMEHLDADTAFLNSLVYMDVPPFDIENDGNHVCRSNKSMYGLKQTSNAWNKTIHQVYAHVCLSVGDMIIAAKTSDESREVKNTLKAAFKMKDLGGAKLFWIGHDKEVGTLMFKQTRYIYAVAERFGQRDTKRVDNPRASKAQLPRTDAKRAEMRSKPCRFIIGRLLYITTCAHPDVAYVVTQLSRFLDNSDLEH
ncbi:LOW QUALITY PROTEIN: hypothetical protein PHMEG_0004224 [Phytophthora megakarya]|uniref:Reverse transcriptase Ty1/copia-type domain-containing protein n=1 Tax=Phytophthora megakarya TaxID=4795 RepID=A0A225WUB5_9STRA|nr:LOW QUALITY PROTEIN: hypothetical protein PHMEG_0004224 [Phytophthora megakarya]